MNWIVRYNSHGTIHGPVLLEIRARDESQVILRETDHNIRNLNGLSAVIVSDFHYPSATQN